MKKLLILVMALLAITVNATIVDVYMVNGNKIKGVLLEQNDSVLIIRPRNMPEGGMFFKPELVKSFSVSGIGRYVVEDGKFVPTQHAKAAKEEKEQKAREKAQQNRVLAANPNEVIGNAFKNTGSVCMSVGVPSLLVGTILVAYGNSGLIALPQTTEEANKNATKSKCSTAGCVLLPFGAALTIVGVPLHVHGKRIAELKFNYTGNGAGVSVDF